MEDANKLNRVIKKTKEREGELKFHKINNLADSELWCYADASLGNLKDGGSQGGHIVLWRNEEGKMSLLNWQSRRLRRVAVSTLAAEAIALVQAVEDVILLNELIYEVTGVKIKVRCFTDCKSLEKTLKSMKHVSEKSLRTYIQSIKENVERGEIGEVEWVKTEKQLANCLTKSGAGDFNLRIALR